MIGSELPRRLELQLPGRVGMEFCLIPRGKFRMGSRGNSENEEPVHEVEITHDFYLGKYPITQEQFGAWSATEDYRKWLKANQELFDRPSSVDELHPHFNQYHGDNLVADSVTWWEAAQFGCWLQKIGVLKKALNRAMGNAVATGLWQARLPTEAEWEYACRAGTETEYCGGDGEPALADVGCYDKSFVLGSAIHEVGKHSANRWGLHDMHGNVWEWCMDVWDAEAYRLRQNGAYNPVALGSTDKDEGDRVLRGGSWDLDANCCRSAYRSWDRPYNRFRFIGFRLSLAPGRLKIREARCRGMDRSATAQPDRGGTTKAWARCKWSDGAGFLKWFGNR